YPQLLSNWRGAAKQRDVPPPDKCRSRRPSFRQPRLVHPIEQMLAIGRTLEWLFYYITGLSEIGLAAHNLGRKLLGAIFSVRQRVTSGQISSDPDGIGRRPHERRDSFVVLARIEMRDAEHMPPPWRIEIRIENLCPVEPFNTLLGLSTII